jgi:hypothetical protein
MTRKKKCLKSKEKESKKTQERGGMEEHGTVDPYKRVQNPK